MTNNNNGVATSEARGNLEMDLFLEGTGETLKVQGRGDFISLFIGSEEIDNKPTVFLDGINPMFHNEITDKVKELNKVIKETMDELKVMAIKELDTGVMVSGSSNAKVNKKGDFELHQEEDRLVG